MGAGAGQGTDGNNQKQLTMTAPSWPGPTVYMTLHPVRTVSVISRVSHLSEPQFLYL